jgi:hypothetical protein
VEEQPLIPKHYLEQKKKLEKSASVEENAAIARRDSEDSERREAERRLAEAEDRKDVEQRLRSFKQITENVYLCARKISKQFRNMQCDCDLSKASHFLFVSQCSFIRCGTALAVRINTYQ